MHAQGSWLGKPEDRRSLMEGAAILRSPVWLARYARDEGVFAAHVNFGISDHEVPSPDDPVRWALMYVLVINHLCFAVYLPEVARESPAFPIKQWVRLWPLRQAVDYPPLEDVNSADLTRLVTYHGDWLPVMPGPGFERRQATGPSGMGHARGHRNRR
jgi:hypothetical protein